MLRMRPYHLSLRNVASWRSCRLFSSSIAKNQEITLSINGKEVSVEQGAALIQACEKAGVHIPRFCYHEKLRIAGNCRMCLVELEKSPKPVASCAMPAMPGMKVHTDTPLVHHSREAVMEMLLANHPLDCPICDQGGECDLQEQSMRYGSDRGRFHEMSGKRAVEDKNIGPLIKTIMTRCIHCTRCVRFANEVAGAPELGSTGRGNDLQIGTYIEKAVGSELSGNMIDLCPVGALTSKPFAFRARSWDLKCTESIDAHDAVGSAIRIDTKGLEVLRVLPRLNDDINEQWINDKTRFACDGQSLQRLTNPLVKVNGAFKPASWSQALRIISEKYQELRPGANEIKSIVGHLVDAETMVVLKELLNKLNSENYGPDEKNGTHGPASGVDFRANYVFNSRIVGIEEADKILIIGSNPRHEAAVMNARIRKSWLHSDDVEIGIIGEKNDLTYDYEYLGKNYQALKDALNGQFGKKLANAKKPMIIVGSGVFENQDAQAVLNLVGDFLLKNKSKFIQDNWQGYNVLQRAASRAATYDLGFATHDPAIRNVKPKILWLIGADEIRPEDVPKDTFVIYQGHNGDIGAQLADIILPGCTPYEKTGTYVNTEGRVQLTRLGTAPPGVAREDWKIVRAVGETLGVYLPYDSLLDVRDRLAEVSPTFQMYDEVQPSKLGETAATAMVQLLKNSKVKNSLLENPIKDFYLTDSIARNSRTMSRCSIQIGKKGSDPDSGHLRPELAYSN